MFSEMFPMSDQIARCFVVMKDQGFIPTLFVTRPGVPPPGVEKAIYSPVTAPQMDILRDFVKMGGDEKAAGMKIWEWEQKTPEVAREAPR